MTGEVEKIAAGLTKARKRVLNEAHETIFGNTRITSAKQDPRVREGLQRLGLTTPYDTWRDTLTPLGLAVRNHLRTHSGDPM